MFTTMFKRALCNKTFLQASSLARFSRINKFSQNTPSDENASLKKEETATEKEHGDFRSNEEELSRLLNEAATYSDANDKSWATTPYPADAPVSVEKQEIEVPKIDPREMSIVIFPGQGTIKVGAVKKYLHFPGAKDIFKIANEILGYNLLKLCLEGPQQKLDETKFNQPATVVSSLAALEKIREERPKVFETCAATAGYSVGELSALIFSGAISLEDGIRLVAIRGNAMQVASDKMPQGMLSVYCTPKAELSQLLKDAEAWARDLGVPDPVCRVSIYLCTQSKILAGNEEALKYIEKNAQSMGLSKLQRLPVSGAFHTPLMQPALKKFSEALREVTLEKPRTAVYSNCTGRPYENVQRIKKLLVKQIVTPVKWEQCMQRMYARPEDDHFPRTFDVGSSGRMKTILKLINAKAADSCVVV
ncbi:hypothetical protein KPH14_005674 [Odynerus spinipes]|uniref:Malonyl-CoA:ACP transacylase (MAT) domain-containing protein n=1 Tax=Odynerus spinipes TaxID=1348599 RepID=A0AAD9RBB6_9HYME|nr:hypothetical protein KPH14_005674 [Odynerus spinipes]